MHKSIKTIEEKFSDGKLCKESYVEEFKLTFYSKQNQINQRNIIEKSNN